MYLDITTDDLKPNFSLLQDAGNTSSTRTLIVDIKIISEFLYASIVNYKMLPFYGSFYDPYISNIPTFQIDLSSIYPDFKPHSETFIYESPSKETVDEMDFEYDVVFRIPPIRKYKILAEIKSVKKAIPKFVSPED